MNEIDWMTLAGYLFKLDKLNIKAVQSLSPYKNLNDFEKMKLIEQIPESNGRELLEDIRLAIRE